MSRSSGMGQLSKGIVIGIVLLLAIIGTMSIFDRAKNNDNPLSFGKNTDTLNKRSSEIPAPSINMDTAKQSEKNSTSTEKTDPSNKKKIDDLEKNSPETPNNTVSEDSFKPVLENERILKEKPIDKPKYGLLNLSAIDPNNQQKQLVSFIVLDKSGKKVAEAIDVKETSFRLPVGKYKVITTLKNTDTKTRNTRPVQSSKIVRISANKKTTRIFKLDPPTTLGVLQVSAKDANSGKTIKANYVIQTEDGKTIATRNNVTHTLFKLKSGSYKVTVKSGNNTDFRTIVVEPGESTKEIFNLQESFKQGKVFVRVSDTRSNRPVNADIIISTANGAIIQQLKAVSQTDIALPPGKYKIRVTGPNGQSSKIITVSAGQAINEVFRFDAQTSHSENEVQITDNVKITPQKETQQTNVTNGDNNKKTTSAVKGSIRLYARNEGNNVPLKSNFYVQLPNGKNIAKKIYSDSAIFSLDPGVYKITVRSKNRKNVVKTVRILPEDNITEVFSLKSTLPPSKAKEVAQTPSHTPVLAPVKPAKIEKPAPVDKKIIPNGFLSVAMYPPSKTHFIVATRSGKKIVELTSVPSANFKLDTGEYVVTAIQNKKRRSKKATVRTGKTTRVNFKAVNFQEPRNNQRNSAISMGILKSRIINQRGQALRGDLTVTNSRGQVVARANSVTVGVFDLPPGPHTVILNYRGLRGSEKVNIRSRETTMQTFTVAPNRSQTPIPNDQRDVKNIIKDKIEQEIRRRF